MTPLAIVTGSGGLIGSASVRHFVQAGYDVIGVENDMRSYFFGPEASTAGVTARLQHEHAAQFRTVALDIRDTDGVERVVRETAGALELLVHAAAQPSHDWAASEPHVDFAINATGTLNLLEAVRRHAPDATFVFCSTNKVYGDRPNHLPLIEGSTRLDLTAGHEYFAGIPVTTPTTSTRTRGQLAGWPRLRPPATSTSDRVSISSGSLRRSLR